MSTVLSTPLAPLTPSPIPASALPNGGSRALGDDVFQTAEEAVLVQSALPDAVEVTAGTVRPRVRRDSSGSVMQTVRSQVAARPCEAALLAAAAGAFAMWALRRRLRGRFGPY
jgi:hypothetical protein